jgi:hypothetical protein
MRIWRVAVGLAALMLFLASMAMGAENLNYSGVPGKWQRRAKRDKDRTAEPQKAEQEGKQEGEKEKGKRTMKVTFSNFPAPRSEKTEK